MICCDRRMRLYFTKRYPDRVRRGYRCLTCDRRAAEDGTTERRKPWAVTKQPAAMPKWLAP